MEPECACSEATFTDHAIGISTRRSSTRERNHFTLPSTVLAAVALCVAFLAPAVNAEDTLAFKVPAEVTLCTPVNFTWTGGIAPYRLDVEPSVNGVPNITANERKTPIQDTWVLYTPDFPAGSRLEINVVGSGFSPSAGGFANVLSSSDTSCLETASTTTSTTSTSSSPSPSSPSLSANGLTAPVSTSSATSSPAVLASSGGGLRKGAIAGIAVAAVLIGIGLLALAAWCLYRRKHRIQQPEKGYDRSIASPALSDSAPTVPYSGLSSTLLSVDPNKLYAFSTPPTSVLGGSSYISASAYPDAPGAHDPLRPTPYLVPRDSTPDSLSDVRKGKPHAFSSTTTTTSTTPNESAANLSTSMSDGGLRAATTASPSQLGSVDEDEGEDEGGGGGGGGGRGVQRFDADRAARLSLSLGSALGGSLGVAFSDIGVSEVGGSGSSNSGEATLPPPYAHYFGGGGGGGGGRGARSEEAAGGGDGNA